MFAQWDEYFVPFRHHNCRSVLYYPNTEGTEMAKKILLVKLPELMWSETVEQIE